MYGKKVLRFLTHLFVVICLFLNLPTPVSAGFEEDPDTEAWGYFSYLYDSSNGLIASDANAVAQIDIGFIWIGGYSGLTATRRKTYCRAYRPSENSVAGGVL